MKTAIATPTPDRPDEPRQMAALAHSLPLVPLPEYFRGEIAIPMTDLATGKRYIKREPVITPGIVQTRNCDFLESVALGHDLYFEETYISVWPDGTEAREILASQVHLLHSVKQRDLTCADLVALLERQLHQVAAGDLSVSKMAGELVGYIATCTADACGLLCDTCGQYAGCCLHPTELEKKAA